VRVVGSVREVFCRRRGVRGDEPGDFVPVEVEEWRDVVRPREEDAEERRDVVVAILFGYLVVPVWCMACKVFREIICLQ
jgi:hypothetical protein